MLTPLNPEKTHCLTRTFISLDREDQYRVLASYTATNIGETSLVEGSFVTIVEKNERGFVIFINDFTTKYKYNKVLS